jgi:ParB family chromosome partitioning protein
VNFVMLKPEQIRASRFQPRADFNETALEELKASIKRSGVVEPVIVRPLGGGAYELVAGERRWRATQALGLGEIPAVIKQLSDREALELSLVENVQRENLNPLEEAKGYARLLEEFGYTQEEIASAVGKDRATISNLLRLLTLPSEIQQALAKGQLTFGHAKALLSVAVRSEQAALFKRVVGSGLSVRQTEALAQGASPEHRRRRQKLAPQAQALEDQLRAALGTKVRLVTRQSGGRIVIDFFSGEDLTRLLKVLGVTAA